MAFPTIPASGSTSLVQAQADTTATRTFPNLTSLTKSAGDLLLAIIIAYQASSTNATFGTWGAGFTEFIDAGNSATPTMAIGAAYKFSSGSETGTFTVTQAATVTGHADMILLNVIGAHPTQVPEATAIATNTAAAADPAALTPSWGSADVLWIAVGGNGETSTAGTFSGMGTAPTNYGNTQNIGISADVVGGVDASVSYRQLTASSEDVGTWASVDVSNARNAALLIAVRPPPVFPDWTVSSGMAVY